MSEPKFDVRSIRCPAPECPRSRVAQRIGKGIICLTCYTTAPDRAAWLALHDAYRSQVQ